MSAVPATKQCFQLFKRHSDDVVKARPFLGDHRKIIAKALDEATNKNSVAITELAKV